MCLYTRAFCSRNKLNCKVCKSYLLIYLDSYLDFLCYRISLPYNAFFHVGFYGTCQPSLDNRRFPLRHVSDTIPDRILNLFFIFYLFLFFLADISTQASPHGLSPLPRASTGTFSQLARRTATMPTTFNLLPRRVGQHPQRRYQVRLTKSSLSKFSHTRFILRD